MTTKIFAPLSGRAIPLGEVSDPVFAKKMLGDGMAIIPANSIVASPIMGKVTMLAETKHAIGLVTEEGIEVLIHIGIDTVTLKGVGFKSLVSIGDSVQIGTPLVEFDPSVLKEHTLDPTTMIIVTNSKDFTIDAPTSNSQVTQNVDPLFSVS
ncbi:PTS glucose transporter subunit IIA [Enterococcus gilvus]|uniref:PTS sugar transporter subunit IIA n=1 Tax=Enterococcus gilvus TaxID=160453 RepID=UPI001C8CAD21|nr:PTS glucose transporter subunit IIA [Enterococcus gilvus]MBX8938827.1 PTS glucose transporter subunit IIA [Enterococcus gilvus]